VAAVYKATYISNKCIHLQIYTGKLQPPRSPSQQQKIPAQPVFQKWGDIRPAGTLPHASSAKKIAEKAGNGVATADFVKKDAVAATTDSAKKDAVAATTDSAKKQEKNTQVCSR
jgi:hypothetical protein